MFWYQSGGDLMAVDVQVKPNLTLGVPRVLFNWQPSWLLRYLEYDVSSDGQRFVLVALADENESVQAISREKERGPPARRQRVAYLCCEHGDERVLAVKRLLQMKIDGAQNE